MFTDYNLTNLIQGRRSFFSSFVDDVTLGGLSTLHALNGGGNPNSLHLSAYINSTPFQLLIDNGSTHNFVQPAFVEKLQLSILNVPPFSVSIGNGDTLVCRHQCPQVAIMIQGYTFVVDLHVLAIAGPSIILGIQWLQTLGKVTHDYANTSMDFEQAGQPISLKGSNFAGSQTISFNYLQTSVQTKFPTMSTVDDDVVVSRTAYPVFHLEDKVVSEDGKIDTTPATERPNPTIAMAQVKIGPSLWKPKCKKQITQE